MSLIFKLARRNLFHDRLRFVATIIGIVFSIVLVTVQMGLFLSFDRMVTTMIDHASADLWIVPRGTKCFEDPSLLDERERFRALSVEGVAEATPVVIGFAQWRMPHRRHDAGLHRRLRHADRRVCTRGIWSTAISTTLSIPGAVAIDQSYFDRLGSNGPRRHRRNPRSEGRGRRR